jgi:urease accessory protein
MIESVKHDPAADFTRIGRTGELVLDYIRQDSKTILRHSSCRSPWHFFPPMALDETGAAYTLLVNPSGGLVGGDHLRIRASLAPQSHVLFSTPSANRVYRSITEPSRQEIQLTVGAGAILEWVPELTIPFLGSRFSQTVHVALESGGTLILWDASAAGRIASGERWRFTSFDNEIKVTTSSGASVLERYRLTSGSGMERAGLAEPWDYLASLFILSEAVEEEVWKRLEEKILPILEDRQGRVLGGVSEPAVRGRIVKLLAKSAPDLNAVFESIWATARALLWGLPFPALRRY